MWFAQAILISVITAIICLYAAVYMALSSKHFSSAFTPLDAIYQSVLAISGCGLDQIHPTTSLGKIVTMSEMFIGFMICLHLITVTYIHVRRIKK